MSINKICKICSVVSLFALLNQLKVQTCHSNNQMSIPDLLICTPRTMFLSASSNRNSSSYHDSSCLISGSYILIVSDLHAAGKHPCPPIHPFISTLLNVQNKSWNNSPGECQASRNNARQMLAKTNALMEWRLGPTP